jgi:peptidoglycan/LPS O-acetylase OafA/YrhL
MSSRIKELDALRGIAALGVALFHFTLGRPEAQLGFKLGITGVDLFFMISGFVIFMSVQKINSALEFVINRLTRLYPTYWTCISITTILQLGLILYSSENPTNLSVIKYILNLTMFQHYFNVNDIDGSYWTMIIEMLFYIFILLLIISKQIKHVIPISMAIILSIFLYTILLEKTFPNLNKNLTYWFNLFAHFPLFIAGILLYKLRENIGKQPINYLLIAFCYVVQASLFENLTKAKSYINFYEYLTMLSLFFTLFILIAHQKLNFIVTKSTLFLGKISFPLYLIHQFVSTVIIIPFVLTNVIQNFWIAAATAFVVSLSLARSITYFIEIPIGKKMNRFLKLKFKLTKLD